MTNIRSVVAATDFSPGSDAAVERAVVITRAHGASLHLLHAFDVSAWHSLRGVFDLAHLTTDPPADVMVQQRLNEAAETLKAQTGLEVVAEFCVGTAEHEIESHVKAHPGSVVVVGSRSEPEVQGLGSTAWKLVRSTVCPVLIVRTPAARPYAKVLTAVDVGEEAAREAVFAVALFPTALHHLLYALDPGLDRALWMGGIPKERVGPQFESMHAHASAVLRQLAQSLTEGAAQAVSAEVVTDVPGRAVAACAKALPAECVVVGHHRRGAVAEGLLGSMAQHVLSHTVCDVLVVP